MTSADRYFVRDIKRIMNRGYKDENPRPHYADGTPAHTLSVNHVVRQYDIGGGDFPILTLRPIAWKGAVKEIFWIYRDASNDLSVLQDKYNIHIWDNWSIDDDQTIGFRYGHTVDRYDLVGRLKEGIRKDPFGRRHVMDLWQEEEFADETKGLMPCAFCTIWNVRKSEGEYFLDMLLIQRSGDMLTASGAGCWNEVQYGALLIMLAAELGYRPGVFTHMTANEQIYDRHMDAAHEMLRRYDSLVRESGKEEKLMLLLAEGKNFSNAEIGDFSLPGYEPVRPQITLDIGI